MLSSLHVSLPEEMHRFVQERANGTGVHATPSEYVRDLIRRDIENYKALSRLRRGMDDFKNGAFSEKSFDDYIQNAE
jgi:antitoxin ParD1/3/4